MLEKDPHRWNALGCLNRWDREKTLSFAEYLTDWRTRAADVHKPFVSEVAALFGLRAE